MIPSLDEVVAAHQFLARRFGVSGTLNREEVAKALGEAAARRHRQRRNRRRCDTVASSAVAQLRF